MRRTPLVLLALAALVVPTSAHAAAGGPSATIGSFDCARGGVVATLSNDGSSRASFAIQRDGTTIDTVVLEGSAPDATRLIPIAKDSASMVTVQVAGAGYVSANVLRECPTAVAGVAAAPTTASTAVATPDTAAQGTGTSARSTEDLPFTGAASTIVLATAGLLLALGGLALHRASRRRGRGRIVAES